MGCSEASTANWAGPGCSPTSDRLGMIGRVHPPEGAPGYVLCPRGHHHHAICSRCGLVLDLPGCPLNLEEIERETQALGFRLQAHRMEYYGVCKACQDRDAD